MTIFRRYTANELRRDGYPTVWDSIGDCVRTRAHHRCVRCQHPYRVGAMGSGEWTRCDDHCLHDGPTRPVGLVGFEAQWRILTVHHLNGDKSDCRWWNLVALCQRCHLTIQGKVKMDRPWMFTHSEWFRPYVAGHYAARYLGEDLTRNEVILRIDELLELEAIHILGRAPLGVK